MKSASGSHVKLEGRRRVLTQTCWRSVIFTPCSDTEEARQLWSPPTGPVASQLSIGDLSTRSGGETRCAVSDRKPANFGRAGSDVGWSQTPVRQMPPADGPNVALSTSRGPLTPSWTSCRHAGRWLTPRCGQGPFRITASQFQLQKLFTNADLASGSRSG